MKDIDFDELDRAVSSILNDDSDSQDDTDQTSSSSSEQIHDQSDIQVVDQPASDTPEVVDQAQEPEPSQIVPAVRRRNGRFMDFVQPGSPKKQPEVDVVSQSESTEDSNPADSLEQSIKTPPVTLESAIDTLAGDDAETSVKEDAHSQPDPLDFHGFSVQDDVESEPKPETHEDDVEPTLESPFIPDARVEKRPLGAFSVSDQDNIVTEEDGTSLPAEQFSEEESSFEQDALTEAPSEHSAEPTDDTTSESDEAASTDDTSADVSATSPQTDGVGPETAEELHSELLSIESEAVHHDEVDESPEPHDNPVQTEKAVLSDGAIAQQYQEKPTDSEQSDNGAIYDTDSYHQPLKHPVKKKSGWLTVVLIFFLVLIGVAGGAAVYFFL